MNKKYISRDFYLTAFILARGCSLLGHSRVNQTTLFEFEETAELRKLVEQYYSMTALIEPMAYGAAIRSLKSVIHASNSNSESNHNVRGKI